MKIQKSYRFFIAIRKREVLLLAGSEIASDSDLGLIRLGSKQKKQTTTYI